MVWHKSDNIFLLGKAGFGGVLAMALACSAPDASIAGEPPRRLQIGGGRSAVDGISAPY